MFLTEESSVDRPSFLLAIGNASYHSWSIIDFTAFQKLLPFLALSHAERTIFRQTLDQKALAVDILAYCLMPNHFHLIVRQNIKEGIHNFLSNVSNGYAKYFNTKRHRVGPLYQGPFKAVFVENRRAAHTSFSLYSY